MKKSETYKNRFLFFLNSRWNPKTGWGYKELRKRRLTENPMKPVEKKNIRIRIFTVGIFFILLYTIIVAKAIYLQIFQCSQLSQRAEGEYEKSFLFSGKRGTIYDIKQREMAITNDVTSIAAYSARVREKEGAARTLARELKLDENILSHKLKPKRTFVWIKRQVTPKEAEAVRSLQLEGIDFIPEYNRFYPNKTLAAQVLGFTGIDGRGLEGVEFFYDIYLTGTAGNLTVFKDALGRGFAKGPESIDAVFSKDGVSAIEKKALPNYSGNNLILTIDRTVQYITEKALSEAVTEFSAKSGIAIVMVPKTGAILALAHFPFFNPNSFDSFSRDLWRNKAITDPFEPGSTMKIFSASAAVESGLCTPDTIFFCENGRYKIGNNIIHDTHAHKWLSLKNIIKYSSNIGAVKVGEKIGSEILYKKFCDFGFGEKTGIDCPGETSGSLSSYKRWSKIDAGAISFGHGISVSAIQLITAVSAIANGGSLMKPYLVQAVIDQNGHPVKVFNPVNVKRVISPQTAHIVNSMMQGVVEEGGTGVKAEIKGYSVCGKTGTAQKLTKEGEYSDRKYIASFVGFVPAEEPEIAIAVIIDEPSGNYYGGIVAAPAFKIIAHETLNYMNIPPRPDTEDKLTALR